MSPQAWPVLEPRVGCRHQHAQEAGITIASDILHAEIQHTNGRVPRWPEPHHLVRGYPSAATEGSQVVGNVGDKSARVLAEAKLDVLN